MHILSRLCTNSGALLHPATLAWLLDQLSIAPDAPVPGDISPIALDDFRRELVRRLRALALPSE